MKTQHRERADENRTASIALVTGASGGIGLAFARVLACEGHELVLTARDGERLRAVQQELEERHHVRVHVIADDLARPGGAETVYGQVRGRRLAPEILVNNAGCGDWGFFAESDWYRQEEIIRLNIAGLTHLTRLVLPDMIARGRGKILNVASTAAFQPGPLMAVYYASKSYVLSFSLAVGNEVKDRGVTVTCLCPGPTATGFQKRASLKDIRLTDERLMADPLAVAQYGYRALMAGKPLAVYGRLNRLLAFGARLLPSRVVVPAVRFMQDSRRRKDPS